MHVGHAVRFIGSGVSGLTPTVTTFMWWQQRVLPHVSRLRLGKKICSVNGGHERQWNPGDHEPTLKRLPAQPTGDEMQPQHQRVTGNDETWSATRSPTRRSKLIQGGKGASVRPISPKDNRGLGASMGNRIRGLKPGTKVEIKPINVPNNE